MPSGPQQILASFTRLRICALLLLAAIGLQAAEPIRAPLERTQGSAFSAATADLALATGRRVETGKAQALPTTALPTIAPTALATPRLALLPTTTPPHLHLRPEVRGPPPRGHPARLPDSTAPPLA